MYVIDAAASPDGQALVLELLTRDRKANGEWGKPKPARLGAINIATHPNDEDREILERLRGPQLHLGWSSWNYAHDISRLQLSQVIAGDLVPRLCATERCFVRQSRRARPAANGPAIRPDFMGRRAGLGIHRGHSTLPPDAAGYTSKAGCSGEKTTPGSSSPRRC